MSRRLSMLIMPLALSTVASAQPSEISSYWNATQHEIRSSVNQSAYQLFVSLPPGYNASDTTTYPVLYALDGNDSFRLLQAFRRYLGEGGAIPRLIIVGVGYPDSANAFTRRTADYTTSSVDDTSYGRVSGRAPAFLETLRRDVIPFIERSYRANGDRALIGHSFGGLFTLYALHAAPELFQRYGIFSPSTWWDNHRLLRQFSNGGRARAPTAARVFVAVGADEDVGMRNEADSVAAILTRVYGERVTMANRRFAGNHMAYLPEALSRGLAFLYSVPACFDDLSATSGQMYSVLSGPERVETERFVRSPSGISGRTFVTGGACSKYRLTVDASGRVTAASLEQNLGVPRTAFGEIRGSRVRFQTTAPAQERSIDATAPTALFVPAFLASLDPLARMAPRRVGDSTTVLLANFRRADAGTAVIARISSDSILVRHRNFELRVHVFGQGEILGGTTTLNGNGDFATRWVVVRRQ